MTVNSAFLMNLEFIFLPNPDKRASSDAFNLELKAILDHYSFGFWDEFEKTRSKFFDFAPNSGFLSPLIIIASLPMKILKIQASLKNYTNEIVDVLFD